MRFECLFPAIHSLLQRGLTSVRYRANDVAEADMEDADAERDQHRSSYAAQGGAAPPGRWSAPPPRCPPGGTFSAQRE
jgi:hypothetical protein